MQVSATCYTSLAGSLLAAMPGRHCATACNCLAAAAAAGRMWRDLLQRAMEKRTVGCTQLNEQSSRSHAVFTLRIEGVNDSSKLKVSCL